MMLRKGNYKFLIAGAAVILLGAFFEAAAAGKEQTVEDLKARLGSASGNDRIELSIQIAERQLQAADKFYTADEPEKARAAIDEVVSFSEKARDYSIQSHKRQKQTEIAVRKMARKLAEIKGAITLPEQPPVQAAVDRLQRVRDDLLAAMFPKEKQ